MRVSAEAETRSEERLTPATDAFLSRARRHTLRDLESSDLLLDTLVVN